MPIPRARARTTTEMSAGGTRAHARNASILKLPRDVVRKVASFLGTREVAGWSCVDKETHAALRGRLADVAALLATFGSLRVDELDGGCCFFTDAEHRPTTDDEAHAGDDAAGDGAAGDGAMYDEAAWVLARHAKQGALVHVRDLDLVRARVSATTARSLGRVLHSDTMPHLRALKLADLQWRACDVCDLTATWARAACAWPNLLELQLQGLRLTGQGLDALLDAAGLPELLRLSLDDNPRLTSDAAGCAAVARALALPRLESIRLQNVGLDDARVVDVLETHASLLAPRATGGASRVSSLRSFDARGNARFGDGALVALAARTDDGGTLHALQSLVLAQTRVGDAGVVALTATCRARGTPSPLERIDLAFARAGVGAMRALATTLRSGDLPCCRSIVLAGAHAPPRAELRDLRVAMGTNWLRKLFVPQQLPRYSVDLSRVAWHDGDVARFAATVQHAAERFARVTALSLAHNEFGATGMRALALAADAMGGHAALRVLDLRGNASLGDAGVVVLAESLLSGAWPGLEKLHLGGIHLECPGMGSLCAAIANGASLRHLVELNLSGNLVGDPGVARLAAAVARPGALRSLRILNLRANAVGDAGVEALVRALRRPNLSAEPPLWQLTRLSLRHNFLIGGAGVGALAKAVRRARGDWLPRLQTLLCHVPAQFEAHLQAGCVRRGVTLIQH